MYCSRCNGLLLEGFMQIVMYGKSLQQEGGAGHLRCDILEASKNLNDCGSHVTNGCQDEIQDPSVSLGWSHNDTWWIIDASDMLLVFKVSEGTPKCECYFFLFFILQFHCPFLVKWLNSFLKSGLWQCTSKGAGKGIALSWCLWWGRSGLD
jgi:hypothetical protein